MSDFGKSTCTVNGKRVHILTTVAGGAYPIIGLFPDDQWAIGRWTLDGKWCGSAESLFNLAPPVPQPRQATRTMVLVGYDNKEPELLMYGRGKKPVIGNTFANGVILNTEVVSLTERL